MLESNIIGSSYTATGLSTGVTYHFKVQARNSYGFSDYSNEISVLAAQMPERPLAPNTTINGPLVDIDWHAPFDNGSPIIGYTILIRKSDNVTYETEVTSCDGSNPTIVSNTICQVPISTLKSAAFDLPWGAEIWCKVIAINLYGQSLVSDAGNGAIILTFPDAPVDL